MAKCEICGKGPQFGHNVSHSKVRTKRRWLPNIHQVTITLENGKQKQVRMCTSCLRTYSKVSNRA
ncbi:MAG: 50S ribosomal protein L28 [Chloroflexi bacterium]|nr:50S ribosomal protein L28 [Chloroflexota bacterium]